MLLLNWHCVAQDGSVTLSILSSPTVKRVVVLFKEAA